MHSPPPQSVITGRSLLLDWTGDIWNDRSLGGRALVLPLNLLELGKGAHLRQAAQRSIVNFTGYPGSGFQRRALVDLHFNRRVPPAMSWRLNFTEGR